MSPGGPKIQNSGLAASQCCRLPRRQLIAQQFQELHPKGVGNSSHDQKTRITLAALNPTHVGQIDIGLKDQ
jgi:hypothetical protein